MIWPAAVLLVLAAMFLALVAFGWLVGWGEPPRFGPDPLEDRAIPTSAGLIAATAPRGSSPSAPGCEFEEAAWET